MTWISKTLTLLILSSVVVFLPFGIATSYFSGTTEWLNKCSRCYYSRNFPMFNLMGVALALIVVEIFFVLAIIIIYFKKKNPIVVLLTVSITTLLIIVTLLSIGVTIYYKNIPVECIKYGYMMISWSIILFIYSISLIIIGVKFCSEEEARANIGQG